MELIDHGLGLTTLEGEVRLPGGLRLPARTTILRLSHGLAVISPLPGISRYAAELAERGEVSVIVAPNRLHHLGLGEAHEAFPGARVVGPAGLQKKVPSVPLDGELGDEPHPAFAGELSQHAVQGLRSVGEVALFHPASRTLVLTDLCFHICRHEHWPTRTFMKLNGAWRRFGPSRLLRSQIDDKRALKGSVEALCAWDPERVVIAHGDVVLENGRRMLMDAFAYLG